MGWLVRFVAEVAEQGGAGGSEAEDGGSHVGHNVGLAGHCKLRPGWQFLSLAGWVDPTKMRDVWDVCRRRRATMRGTGGALSSSTLPVTVIRPKASWQQEVRNRVIGSSGHRVNGLWAVGRQVVTSNPGGDTMSPSSPYMDILSLARVLQDILSPCYPSANFGYLRLSSGNGGLSTIKPPKGPSETVHGSKIYSSFICSGSHRAGWPLS